MRLLAKREIDILKSTERTQVANEGLKLAKRIDALREVNAQEEASLAKFRNKTLGIITGEILSETAKKDGLKQEVQELEDRKAEALRPLTKELEMIKQSQQVLNEKSETLGNWRDELDTKDSELTEREIQVSFEEKRVKDMHTRTEGLLIETATIKDNAERQDILASETLRKAEQESSLRIEKAMQREEWVAMREATSYSKEEELKEKETELENGFIRLRDRESTYARNISRLK